MLSKSMATVDEKIQVQPVEGSVIVAPRDPKKCAEEWTIACQWRSLSKKSIEGGFNPKAVPGSKLLCILTLDLAAFQSRSKVKLGKYKELSLYIYVDDGSNLKATSLVYTFNKKRYRATIHNHKSVIQQIVLLQQFMAGNEVKLLAGDEFKEIAIKDWGLTCNAQLYSDQYADTHTAVKNLIVRIVMNTPRSPEAPVEILDLFCGRSVYTQEMMKIFGKKGEVKAHLVDNNNQNLEAIGSSSHSSTYQCDLTKAELPGGVPSKVQVMTIIGGLTRVVVSQEEALSIWDKVKDRVKVGGYVIIGGTQMPWITPEILEESGYRVHNTYLPIDQKGSQTFRIGTFATRTFLVAQKMPYQDKTTQ